MKKQHKPHPPADAEWPEHVKKMYEAGCIRIDELRKQIDDDGLCPIPFRCYSCDDMRSDFAMLTSGCPMCQRCFNGCVDAIDGKVPV